MNYIIGIDIGTTATKGILYNNEGIEVCSKSHSYHLIQNEVDQAEEDPLLIYQYVEDIITELSREAKGQVCAISWSSQMHSLIGLDKDKNPLTNIITWADNRSKHIVSEAKESGLGLKIYNKTGIPIHPMAPVYKLMWLKQDQPKLFSEVRYWVGIKEYIIYRLNGEFDIDVSMAAGTGLLNVQTLQWDEEILNMVSITSDQLPKIFATTAILGKITPECLKKFGLSEETKLIAGASDGYLSTIGVGVIGNKEFVLNVGTSGAIRTLSPKPDLDKSARIFCYAASNNQFLLGGPVNNGGIIYQWAQEHLFESKEDLIKLAQKTPAGSNGLIFHPYLGGERAPLWNSDARGSFTGLNRNHGNPQIARSVLEGIVMNLYDAAQVLFTNSCKPDAIRVTGGFMASEFICQLTANIFDLPIVVMKNHESGTMAAMFLARLALGISKDFSEIKKFVSEDKVFKPEIPDAAVYRELFPIYQNIEHQLEATYSQIARFQATHS